MQDGCSEQIDPVQNKDEYSESEFIIQHQADCLLIEKALRELKTDPQLSVKTLQELEMIAGELSENIIKHCGQGKITIRYYASRKPYIEIVSENTGKLPPRAQEDGFSTQDTLGIGLGVISRFADIVTYEQIGETLRIRTVKYCEEFPNRSEVAVLSFPVLMREKTNGDAFLIHKNETDLFCVIDALGHGEEAFVSATAVQKFLRQNYALPTDTLIYKTHDFIQTQKVRGVALSVIRIDYARKRILYSGLGDVMVKIFLPTDGKTLYPMPKEGIVGDILRTLDVQEFPLVPGAIIAMYSDGLSNKLSLPPELRLQKPIFLVNELMKQYGRKHDDRTLLMAKVL